MTRVRGNSTSPSAQPMTAREQMENYDRLPASFRRLVGSLPTPVKVADVLNLIHSLGEADARKFILQRMRQLYPEWREDLK